MDPDRIEAALTGLGPESRALVELSVIREVADDDIAGLLGTDEGAVRSRREDALAQLATALGADSADEVGQLVREMRELPAVRWRADADADGPAARPPGPKRRRRLGPLLFGAALVAAVALVLALSGGDGAAPPPDEPASTPAPGGKRAKLRPLTGGGAEGNAEVRNGTLDLSVSGLADPGGAGYVVWLYDSLSDARPLNRPQPGREFELRTKLPQGAARYHFLDVSLEPADGNRNHSGQSVLRVPLSSLR